MRAILEHIECSFARQEAKLDRILSIVTAPRMVESPCPRPQTQQKFSTPNLVPCPSQSLSLEYSPPAVSQRTPLPDVDRLLDDPDLTGTQCIFKLKPCANLKKYKADQTVAEVYLIRPIISDSQNQL